VGEVGVEIVAMEMEIYFLKLIFVILPQDRMKGI
jgi:hypothetical protein